MYYNNYICQKLGKIENLKIKKNKSAELKKNDWFELSLDTNVIFSRNLENRQIC